MYLKKGTQFKKETLSTGIEYYQRNTGKILKAFQNTVPIFKIDSIDFSFFFIFICRQGFKDL